MTTPVAPSHAFRDATRVLVVLGVSAQLVLLQAVSRELKAAVGGQMYRSHARGVLLYLASAILAFGCAAAAAARRVRGRSAALAWVLIAVPLVVLVSELGLVTVLTFVPLDLHHR